VAEIVLLIAVAAIPVALGAAAVALRRPWWWGALLAVVVFLVAAIAPEPEEGESRVAGGDVAFLVVVALFVVGLTWVGAWAMRRFRRA
jgi:hypothetical protein